MAQFKGTVGMAERAAQEGRDKAANLAHNFGCLRKHNVGSGAGWKSRKGSTIGGRPSGTGGGGDNHAFAIRRKKRSSF